MNVTLCGQLHYNFSGETVNFSLLTAVQAIQLLLLCVRDKLTNYGKF